MKAQVLSTEIETRTIPAKEGRAELTFRQQKAAVLRPNDFPLPFKLTLEPDQEPYQPGTYDLSETSLTADEYGALGFSRRIVLTPEQKAGKPAAGGN